MAREIAYVLINPYTIAKSRTGGVIARYLSRTGLDLVAARMFGPSRELVERYSQLIRNSDPGNTTGELIADYILNSYAPDGLGKRRRVMMLLFEGDAAVAKVWEVTGSSTLRWGSGETIRDTFGDYVLDDDGNVKHFEPAVLVGPSKKRVMACLRLWREYAERDGGLVENAVDVFSDEKPERTLVMLKPDNFRTHSSRPGNVIDLLSLSGLRIIGVKKFSMTVAQAEEFYGPVKEVLKEKMKGSVAERGKTVLEQELGVQVPDSAKELIGETLGPLVGEREFESIVKFMTGYRPSECSPSKKLKLCGEECLGLVYSGPGAVAKIRELLGATDPAQAKEGSVRREHGSNILENAAHASDSPENAEREIGIIDMGEDTIGAWVDRYCGDLVTRVKAHATPLPVCTGSGKGRMKRLWNTVARSADE